MHSMIQLDQVAVFCLSMTFESHGWLTFVALGHTYTLDSITNFSLLYPPANKDRFSSLSY